MPLSNNPATYEDIRAALDQALASPKGIKITVKDSGAAVHYRHRCYKYRVMDREENSRILPRDHPLYNRSAYDVLVVDTAGPVVYIRKPVAQDLQIEEIA